MGTNKLVEKWGKLPLPVSTPALNPRFRGVRMSRVLVFDFAVPVPMPDGSVIEVLVPAGFEYDASIPNLALVRRIAGSPYDPDLEAAACVHDWLYQTNWLPRDVADRIYLVLLRWAGVSEWRAWLHYRMLRMFGGAAYRISDADADYIDVITEELRNDGRDIEDFRPVVWLGKREEWRGKKEEGNTDGDGRTGTNTDGRIYE